MARREHHTPRAYLQRFAAQDTERRAPFVWTADRTDQRVYRQSPRKAAAIEGFYDWRDPQLKEQAADVETLLAEIESRTLPVFDALIAGKPVLDEQARYYMATYVAFQLGRSPTFRDAAKKAVEAMALEAALKLLDETSLASIQPPPSGAGLDRSAIREALTSGRVRPSANPDYLVQGQLAAGHELTRDVFVGEWLVLVPGTGSEPFLTSDNPVVMLTPDGQPRNRGSTDLSYFFPLAPSAALLIRWARQDEVAVEFASANANQTRALNKQIASLARRHVFTSHEEQAEWALSVPRGPNLVGVQSGS